MTVDEQARPRLGHGEPRRQRHQGGRGGRGRRSSRRSSSGTGPPSFWATTRTRSRRRSWRWWRQERRSRRSAPSRRSRWCSPGPRCTAAPADRWATPARSTWGGGAWIEVTDTLKPGGKLIVHQGKVAAGTLRRGETVQAEVDGERRQAIRLNHSATHLLHHALRRVLGTHVAQKGSEVAPLQLRFDFSHFEAMTAEQLRRRWSSWSTPRSGRGPAAAARRRCPSRTRRRRAPWRSSARSTARRCGWCGSATESVELCGGTHVERAGEIGLFKIVNEEALALGVRRIVRPDRRRCVDAGPAGGGAAPRGGATCSAADRTRWRSASTSCSARSRIRSVSWSSSGRSWPPAAAPT